MHGQEARTRPLPFASCQQPFSTCINQVQVVMPHTSVSTRACLFIQCETMLCIVRYAVVDTSPYARMLKTVAAVERLRPQPPTSSETRRPAKPSCAAARSTSTGKWLRSSQCALCGWSSFAANCSATLAIDCCDHRDQVRHGCSPELEAREGVRGAAPAPPPRPRPPEPSSGCGRPARRRRRPAATAGTSARRRGRRTWRTGGGERGAWQMRSAGCHQQLTVPCAGTWSGCTKDGAR